MIADSLPDHFGSEVIRSYFIYKGQNPAAIGPLDMLAYIGTSGFGALVYHPVAAKKPTKERDIDLFSLWDQTCRLLFASSPKELPKGNPSLKLATLVVNLGLFR